RLRLVGGQQFAPLEVTFCRQNFPFRYAMLACSLAYLVRCFQRQQMLVTGDDVQRRQGIGEMRIKGVGAELHVYPRGAMGSSASWRIICFITSSYISRYSMFNSVSLPSESFLL